MNRFKTFLFGVYEKPIGSNRNNGFDLKHASASYGTESLRFQMDCDTYIHSFNGEIKRLIYTTNSVHHKTELDHIKSNRNPTESNCSTLKWNRPCAKIEMARKSAL